MTQSIRNDTMALEIEPAFGARVTSLRDLRTGREWLVRGPVIGDPCDSATYRAEQARGWDECFPTVATCHHQVWGEMRDHGALWGRPWHDEGNGKARYEGPGYRFARQLALDGASILATYELSSTGSKPLDWMWSQHCLLAARPGERLVLDGIGPLDRPDLPDRISRDGTVLKAYGPVGDRASVGLDGPGGSIRIEWQGDEIGHVGVWVDFGGWPEEAPVHQVALEPTTAPADDLVSAGNEAETLAPGESRRWHVTIRLGAGGEGQA